MRGCISAFLARFPFVVSHTKVVCVMLAWVSPDYHRAVIRNNLHLCISSTVCLLTKHFYPLASNVSCFLHAVVLKFFCPRNTSVWWWEIITDFLFQYLFFCSICLCAYTTAYSMMCSDQMILSFLRTITNSCHMGIESEINTLIIVNAV